MLYQNEFTPDFVRELEFHSCTKCWNNIIYTKHHHLFRNKIGLLVDWNEKRMRRFPQLSFDMHLTNIKCPFLQMRYEVRQ